jgi:histone-lysine N-methyltransferase SETMAR
MLIVAFDIHGVAFWESLGQNETVNSKRYKAFLKRFVPGWLQTHAFCVPLILHDNARPHKHRIVREFIVSEGWEVLRHPLYSPDFHGIVKIRDRIRGKRFATWHEMNNAVEAAITVVNYLGLAKGVARLPEIWLRVIDEEGNYY